MAALVLQSNSTLMSLLLLLFLLPLLLQPKSAAAWGQLRKGYYAETCPAAENTVREAMRAAMGQEIRHAASVMRLQFHDCFVNGCDGSVLLDDTAEMVGEKLALSNINSLRSFQVIDAIKEAVEAHCPGVVSCADIIIMASRDAVVLSGGPEWDVKLGRKDSLTASQADADRIMPSPRANASYLITLFEGYNLSVTDLVALSGSHSIGFGRCFSIVFRLYNQSGSGQQDRHMDPIYGRMLNKLCPQGGDGNITGGLDVTPAKFDNQYFKDLIRLRGFLNSDQSLFSDDERTKEVVQRFANDENEFFDAFVEGMVKMGDVYYDKKGEIRRNCRVANGRLGERVGSQYPKDF